MEITEYKRKWLIRSYLLMIAGLFVMLIFLYIATPYQLTEIAETYVIQGREHYQLGQYNQSFDDYSKAANIDPRLASAWNGKGLASSALGKKPEALTYFSRALAEDANYTHALYNKGCIYMEQELFNESMASFLETASKEQLLHESCSDINLASKAWNNIGHIYMKWTNYPEALKSFENATEIDPNNTEAWCNMGNILGCKVTINESIKCFDEALDLDPTHLKALVGKAEALKIAGRPDEAAKIYNQIKNLASPDTSNHYLV